MVTYILAQRLFLLPSSVTLFLAQRDTKLYPTNAVANIQKIIYY
jgi:hypothetical protein